MEDAEEQVHYRLPLVEDRQQLPLPAAHEIPDTGLEQKMETAGIELAASLGELVGLVEKLHDGRLYRADFQVAGFWTLGIRFRRLPGRTGWFFGARPEFYFPTLPLSWGLVGTVLFVFPFMVANIILGAGILAAWLVEILPALPQTY